MANDEVRMTNGTCMLSKIAGFPEGDQLFGKSVRISPKTTSFCRRRPVIPVWAAGGFVWLAGMGSNTKVCRSRGISTFVGRVFSAVIVRRCWIGAYVLCAERGSHILAAKLPGFAPVGIGTKLDSLAIACSRARKSGWSFVMEGAVSCWLSAFSQSP